MASHFRSAAVVWDLDPCFNPEGVLDCSFTHFPLPAVLILLLVVLDILGVFTVVGMEEGLGVVVSARFGRFFRGIED